MAWQKLGASAAPRRCYFPPERVQWEHGTGRKKIHALGVKGAMAMKKLGFGLMRLPQLDRNNAADVDVEQV